MLQPAEDLDGNPVHRALDASNVLRAVSLDRDRLAQQSCRRDDDLRCPADVKPGQVRGSLHLSGLGQPMRREGTAADVGADVMVVAKFGANDPATGIIEGGSAL